MNIKNFFTSFGAEELLFGSVLIFSFNTLDGAIANGIAFALPFFLSGMILLYRRDIRPILVDDEIDMEKRLLSKLQSILRKYGYEVAEDSPTGLVFRFRMTDSALKWSGDEEKRLKIIGELLDATEANKVTMIVNELDSDVREFDLEF
jgi:hypothetical protein